MAAGWLNIGAVCPSLVAPGSLPLPQAIAPTKERNENWGLADLHIMEVTATSLLRGSRRERTALNARHRAADQSI
jgi:hypothetical protein